jgi:hypothetical protein
MLTQKNVYRLFTLTLAILLLSMTSIALPTTAQDVESVPTVEHDPAFAVEWMQTLYEVIQAEGVSAPAASRLYAYAGVTLYEALVPGIEGNYSLAGQIESMPEMPFPDEGVEYDWPSVANATMFTVTDAFFPNGSVESHATIAELREQQALARLETVNADVIDRSLEFGDELGAALNEWIASDGFADTRGVAYELPVGDGLWTPTTEGTNPAEPYWGQIRPFALDYADRCAVEMNLEYSSDPDSTFYAQAMEVKEVGDNLTEEQQATARFWVDTPAITGTPAGHWVSIENQLVEQLDLPLDRAAEMYALVGMSLADAFISCWSLKYQVNLLRPETYIHANIRRSWQPYIQTPPFPEYPSGHSVVSAAAAEVLTGLFGTVAFTDATHVSRGEAPRWFTSFEAAATEAAISRLYGGIHYRLSIENGMRQGRCVGQRVLDNIQLNPIRQGGEG